MSARLDETLSALDIPTAITVGGTLRAAADGKTFDCISPIDGRTLAAVPESGKQDVDEAVKTARAVFEAGTWAGMAPRERKAKLFAFADRIEANAEHLALLETIDMGKPIRDSRSIDVPATIGTIRWYAEAVDKIYDEIAPMGHDTLGLITREPVGVVAAVVPWNYPMLMAAWKLGPALAAGNCVILKPAEQSPLTAMKLGELALDAGLPEGVFQVLTGHGEISGQALGLHPGVDMIAFTGSTEVGKLFLGYSAQSNMKRISLECGGKTPNIVFADALDLDEAAKSAAQGVFENTGQVCTAATRLLVERSIYDDFMGRVAEHAKSWVPADPLDPETVIGSVVDKAQMDRILSYVEIGKSEGATLSIGGHRMGETGFYVAPTIFGNVDNRMRIAQEEIFGPVLSAIPFDDAADAIRIANDTIYGLQAAVWTGNINTAHKTARALRAGTVNVNAIDAGDITVPFGGFKQSGIGRDKSLHAYDKYTEMKTTNIVFS